MEEDLVRQTGRTQRKMLGSLKEPTTDPTHLRHWAGIEPWPHWWEARDLTTVPSLLPVFLYAPCVVQRPETEYGNNVTVIFFLFFSGNYQSNQYDLKILQIIY